ncbi:MAG: zinc metallopeptidase [Ruminiclostridium sp.]|nr:zinc metallopeptidase [Ruminiclostridium sp.]
MEIVELLLNNTVITILLFAAIIYSMIASASVKSTFAKYNKIYASSKMPACDVARQILEMNGIYDIQIVRVAGNLTDHYDPRKKIIALSDTVYGSSAVGAIGVAAHECGHAIQYAKSYGPIKARNTLAPVVNICSQAWVWVFMIGCALGSLFMAEVGIVFFSVVVLFQLITLPVEFDASNRAIKTLVDTGILYGEEVKGARKVLKAAAMTYVSALLVSLLQLLRLISSTRSRKR